MNSKVSVVIMESAWAIVIPVTMMMMASVMMVMTPVVVVVPGIRIAVIITVRSVAIAMHIRRVVSIAAITTASVLGRSSRSKESHDAHCQCRKCQTLHNKLSL